MAYVSIPNRVFSPQLQDAAEKEWEAFAAERKAGVEEITALRQKVVEEEERKRLDRERIQEAKEKEKETLAEASTPAAAADKVDDVHEATRDAAMDVDDEGKDDRDAEPEKKDDRMEGDDDDAVEY